MRMEAGRTEVLGICHWRLHKQVGWRRLYPFRWWLKALIGGAGCSSGILSTRHCDTPVPHCLTSRTYLWLLTTSSHRLQGEIECLPGVQQGRVEQGQVTVLRFDK